MRIAVVGGSSYIEETLDSFLANLFEKYPYATIVTGTAMRSCEPRVAEVAHRLGFKLERPEANHAAFGDEAMDCQVNDVLLGADVIVTVGSATGGRAKLAATIWKRCHSWREEPIPLHNIAAPKVAKKTATQRAKKPHAQLAA